MTTVKEMKAQITALEQELNIEAIYLIKDGEFEWNSKTKKADVEIVLNRLLEQKKRRMGRVEKIVALGGKASIQQTNKELQEIIARLTVEKEEKEQTTVEQPVKGLSEKERQASIEFINKRVPVPMVSEDTPDSELLRIGAMLKEQDIKLYNKETVQQAITQATEQAVEATKEEVERMAQVAEQAATDNRPTVDVGELYDTIQAKISALTAEAKAAYDKGDIAEGDELINQSLKLKRKQKALSAKHKEKIFTVERSARIVAKARQTVAEGLRTSADATDKYGHKTVNGLIDLANQLLDGTVKAAQVVVQGSETILRTGVDVTGKAAHVVVDAVVDTQNMAADVIEPK